MAHTIRGTPNFALEWSGGGCRAEKETVGFDYFGIVGEARMEWFLGVIRTRDEGELSQIYLRFYEKSPALERAGSLEKNAFYCTGLEGIFNNTCETESKSK